MEIQDLRAIWTERRARVVELMRDLEPTHHTTVEAIISEADRRMSGDVSALSDKPLVRSRINRVVADLLEQTLQAFGMRGQAYHVWHERKHDLTALLAGAAHPTRSARKLITSLLSYGDLASVEVLTAPASRVWLAAMNIDLRALQLEAVRWLVAERERTGGTLPPAARFCLAQASEVSLHELVSWALLMVPTFP